MCLHEIDEAYAVLCRDCDTDGKEARAADGVRSNRRNRPVPDQLCSRCGHLLGTDDIVERVLRKQSQLALFGLAGSRRPLLKRSER